MATSGPSDLGPVVDRNADALMSDDIEAFALTYDPDAQIRGPEGQVFHGRNGAAEFRSWRARVTAEFQMEALNEIVSGATLLREGTFRYPIGDAPLQNDAPTQDEDDWSQGRYAEAFTVRDGLIVEHLLYLDDPYAYRPPWDVGSPQPAIVRLADDGLMEGAVLDAGCGTGENALFLAERGHEVTGVDLSPVGILKARLKAVERRLSVRFISGDVIEHLSLSVTYDTVVDCGLLHILQPAERARYLDGLRKTLRPGGRFHIMGLSDKAIIDGPTHFARRDIEALFSSWQIEGITRDDFLLSPVEGLPPHPGAAWLATIRQPWATHKTGD